MPSCMFHYVIFPSCCLNGVGVQKAQKGCWVVRSHRCSFSSGLWMHKGNESETYPLYFQMSSWYDPYNDSYIGSHLLLCHELPVLAQLFVLLCS